MAIPPLDGNISVITTPDGKRYHVKDLNSRGILTEITAAMHEKVDCKTNVDSFYGTCATAAATAAKVVELDTAIASGDYAATDDNFSLRPGVRISVKFINTNTANNPTLNVNSTGAKPIWYGSAAITTASLNMAGYANSVSSFVYDGAHWVWNGAGVDSNTTYGNMPQTEASAGTVTTGRVISAKVLSTTIDEKIQPLENNILSDNIISTSFTWSNGYISTGGHIFASSQSYFSQPFTLHAGEKIVVRTKNKNICIIGTTTADSVAVGNNISILRTTSGVDQEETYDYTATGDVKIVICVLASNYVAYVANHNTDLLLGSYATAAIQASQSDLSALSETVATKASASDLSNLSNTVATKASTSDLSALSDTVEEIQNTISPEDITENDPSWKKGYLSSSNGAMIGSDSGSYYILLGYYSAEGISQITTVCSTNYRAKLFGYDENHTGIGSVYNYYGGSKTWNVFDAKYYCVGIKKADESIIDPDTINSNVQIVKTPLIKDLYNRSNVLDFPISSFDIKDKINISSAVARYNALFENCGANVESLIFFSDPHIYYSTAYPDHQRMLATIQEAYNATPASFVVSGGDWLTDGDTRAEACNKLAYIAGVCDNAFRDKIIQVLGNHDTNYQGVDGQGTANSGQLSDNSLNALWYNKYGQRYFKYESVHTSFYVLDTGTDWDATVNTYRQNQLIWLANQVKDETGNVAIVQHIWNNVDAQTAFATEVGKIITSYNSRGSYGIGSEVIDFTSSAGKIKFVLTGHEHKDFSTTVSNVPVIGIINSLKDGNVSFDMIFVDYDNNQLKCIRSGQGSDRTFTIQ